MSKFYPVASFVCLLAILMPIVGDFDFVIPELFVGSYSEIKKSESLTMSTTYQNARMAQSSTETNSLIFLGDILLARNVEILMKNNGDKYPFAGVDFDSFSNNPLVFGNFEAAVPTKHTFTENGQLKFSVPEDNLPSLYRAGLTHLSLANNHTYDFGSNGYVNTINALDKQDIQSFGNPFSVNNFSYTIVNVNNKSIAVVGINFLHSAETSEITKLMEKLQKVTDFQIAYPHWGNEYELTSSFRQKEQAASLVKAGFDLIVGHHPHVVQEIEIIDKVPVIYSLGNYIFDQYFSSAVQTGLILQLSITDTPYVSLIPVTSLNRLSQPNLMDVEDHEEFLLDLSAKSKSVPRRDILNGRVYLKPLVASLDKIAMISQ